MASLIALFKQLIAYLTGKSAGKAEAKVEAEESFNVAAQKIAEAGSHAPADRDELARRLRSGAGF